MHFYGEAKCIWAHRWPLPITPASFCLRAGRSWNTSGQMYNQQNSSSPFHTAPASPLEVARGKDWPFGKAQWPSDSTSQAPLLIVKWTGRSVQKTHSSPLHYWFSCEKRQANPLNLVAAIRGLAVASLLYQKLALPPSPGCREPCLLADVSLIQNATSYKESKKKNKSHIRRWTPALRSPLQQVYIPLSQHHATSASPPARSGKTSYSQGPLLSEGTSLH